MRQKCGDPTDEQTLESAEVEFVTALRMGGVSQEVAWAILQLLTKPEVRESVRIVVDLTPSR